MPKYEDNKSVMNQNLVYFSLMGYLISSDRSFQTAYVGNTHSAIWIFNNDHVEISNTFE